ncbi:dUTP diphosphatase [Alkalitalea saponilacus]|uniref:Deoxyuridine 5'-triphosphate nucleotidohydrolase n=1 Tax=Alkalitalea saponilacus TaxID=889453 RepID=A0A1T5EAP5_9BACT|nr:dUTP diphosphatase [Alkalitalea saponilacus]ASB49057.1 deoxyuridine 5'-triphosphate nucleotidohydrolase [Alkalitalea saponilacus]SKB80913.1 dUTP pyrophosphatase [Alkalitalea saponilacus]
MIEIKVVNKSNNPLPEFATSLSAGVDLRAFIAEDIELKPMERILVPTGLYIELPEGFEAQIRPRSGLAYKHGISVLNSPGTIDADYRGEIKVILINLSNVPFIIKNGERICQMVINKFENFNWSLSESLSESVRGEGGFGHTGKN